MGVGSEVESNTLTMPPFSPTNTLPPGAKAMAVGRVNPLHTAVSVNPVGTAARAAGDVGAADLVARPRTSPRSPGRVAAAADTGAAENSAMPSTTGNASEQILRMTVSRDIRQPLPLEPDEHRGTSRRQARAEVC